MDLGLNDTTALQALFRHAPLDMTFNQVIRALAQEGQYIDPSRRAGEPSAIREHRLFEGDHIDRVPVELDVHRSNLDVITWRNGGTSERSDHFGLIAPKNSKAKQTPYGANRIYGDNINRNKLLRRASYTAADAYKTTTQVENMHGIGKAGAPLTSAGYQTKDHGLLRNQIYSAIHELSAGNVSVSEFELMLQRIGVEIPNEVQWLLTKYKANGDAKFKEFVRAFEPYFETHSKHVEPESYPNRATLDMGDRDDDDAIHDGNRRTVRASMNVSSAGDIISWVGTDAAKTDETLTHDRGRVHYDPLYASSTNILNWDNQAAEPYRPRTAPAAARLYHNTSNIVAWSDSQSGPGDSKVSKRRFAWADSGIPYGTDLDAMPHDGRNAPLRNDNRKHRTTCKAHVPSINSRRTGEWFEPPPPLQSRYVSSSVPFGTDRDVQK